VQAELARKLVADRLEWLDGHTCDYPNDGPGPKPFTTAPAAIVAIPMRC
jgi:hypothetical protein